MRKVQITCDLSKQTDVTGKWLSEESREVIQISASDIEATNHSN